MNIEQFLNKLRTEPTSISFNETIALIDAHYDFKPTAFSNGDTENAAGQNNGSCKLLAFALLNQLSTEDTLHCFGDYYRVDVLEHPEKEDHQNIRNLIKHGMKGIRFEGQALTLK